MIFPIVLVIKINEFLSRENAFWRRVGDWNWKPNKTQFLSPQVKRGFKTKLCPLQMLFEGALEIWKKSLTGKSNAALKQWKYVLRARLMWIAPQKSNPGFCKLQTGVSIFFCPAILVFLPAAGLFQTAVGHPTLERGCNPVSSFYRKWNLKYKPAPKSWHFLIVCWSWQHTVFCKRSVTVSLENDVIHGDIQHIGYLLPLDPFFQP